MRPEAVAAMKRQKGPAEKVYGVLTDTAGLRIPSVESTLGSLS